MQNGAPTAHQSGRRWQPSPSRVLFSLLILAGLLALLILLAHVHTQVPRECTVCEIVQFQHMCGPCLLTRGTRRPTNAPHHLLEWRHVGLGAEHLQPVRQYLLEYLGYLGVSKVSHGLPERGGGLL